MKLIKLRNWLRRWLEMGDLDKDFMNLRNYVNEKLDTAPDPYYLALEQKLDAVCDLLDIWVESDCVTGDGKAFTGHAKNKDLLESHKEYVGKAITAEKILAAQYKMFQQCNELMSQLNWRKKRR